MSFYLVFSPFKDVVAGELLLFSLTLHCMTHMFYQNSDVCSANLTNLDVHLLGVSSKLPQSALGSEAVGLVANLCIASCDAHWPKNYFLHIENRYK